MKPFRNPDVPLRWVVLCAVLWMSVGLFGREPYKPDEAYTVGLVKSIAETGDWVVPRLVGEPFMEKPPLFFIVAALGARATATWLPLHEGARVAVLLFVGLGLLAIGAGARALYGNGAGANAVLLLLATFGAVFRLHQLITDTALFAGVAVGQYGLIVARDRARLGGVALGLGAAVAFMAKGLLGVGILGVTSVLLLAAPNWRTGEYARALRWATAVAVPLVAVWPMALFLRSAELFYVWFWDNNIGRFFGLNSLGPKNEPLFYVRLLSWYAWPCWPLLAWWAYRRVRGMDPPAGSSAPLALFAVGLAVLSLASDARELYALVLLPPLAVLAAGAIRAVSARAQMHCARIAAALALVLAALIVGVWVAAWNDPTFVRRLPELLALPEMRWPSALVLTVYGLAALLLAALLARSIRMHSASLPLAGAAGVALVWGSLMLPWHDYLDDLKGYSHIAASLRHALPVDACAASVGLGESERALLDYFAGLRTQRLEVHGTSRCPYLLVQTRATGPVPVDASCQPIWLGARPGHDTSSLTLYRCNPDRTPPYDARAIHR